jgi:hypothetical protein
MALAIDARAAKKHHSVVEIGCDGVTSGEYGE